MSPLKNIILIGFMGSGKTVTGKEISKILKFRFWDMDQWIEEENTLKIREIFREKGEHFFREQEKKATQWLSRQRGYVASAGGGAWLEGKNRKRLLKAGWCIWLKVTPQEVWKRVGSHLNERPLLRNSKNPQVTIKSLLKKREPYYALAHAELDTTHKSPKQVAREIVKIMKKARF